MLSHKIPDANDTNVNTEQKTKLTDLPEEVLLNILDELPAKAQSKMARTCRFFRTIANDESLQVKKHQVGEACLTLEKDKAKFNVPGTNFSYYTGCVLPYQMHITINGVSQYDNKIPQSDFDDIYYFMKRGTRSLIKFFERNEYYHYSPYSNILNEAEKKTSLKRPREEASNSNSSDKRFK